MIDTSLTAASLHTNVPLDVNLRFLYTLWLFSWTVLYLFVGYLHGDGFSQRWPGAEIDERGWHHVEGFGAFLPGEHGWGYHQTHGWVFAEGGSTEGVTFFDANLSAWGWTSETVAPWVYWYPPHTFWTFVLPGNRPAARQFFATGTPALGWETEISLSQTMREQRLASFVPLGGTYTVATGEESRFPSMQHPKPSPREWFVSQIEIARVPVTYREWRSVFAWAVENGYQFLANGRRGAQPNLEPWPDEPGADRHPVVGVTWYDTVAWANARSEREGLRPAYFTDAALTTLYRGLEGTDAVRLFVDWTADGYRLPSEIEWEKAALAGRSFAGATEPGNYRRPSHPEPRGTTPVASYPANPYGLHDMAGNVWEWTGDWYAPYWYFVSRVPTAQPFGPDAGQFRILRGGSWSATATEAAPTFRFGSEPMRGYVDVGFRLARRAGALPSPALDVETSPLDLGEMEAGGQFTHGLSVTNPGSADVPVVVEGGLPDLRIGWNAFVVPAGETKAVPVRFTPLAAGPQETSVILRSGGTILAEIALSGKGLPAAEGMVPVQGGFLPAHGNANAVFNHFLKNFQIGRHEVTWGEWRAVRDWAVERGYKLEDAGIGCADDHPVENISPVEALLWLNALSEREGLQPVYLLDGAVFRRWTETPHPSDGIRLPNDVEWDASADGYRLPTAEEWRFAALGGLHSQGFRYPGGDELDAVAWYMDNSHDPLCPRPGSFFTVPFIPDGLGTRPVGQKLPNELGLYDMAGNVDELVWSQPPIAGTHGLILLGGSFGTSAGIGGGIGGFDGNRAFAESTSRTPRLGLRLARSILRE